MKILYDYTAFVVQERGGVSRVLYEVMSRVANHPDVDARVFCGFHCNHYLRERKKASSLRVIGLYLPRRFLKQRIFLPLNKILFKIYAQRFNPDLCHYTFFRTPELPSHCKIVVTVHDMISEIFPRVFHPKDIQAKLKKDAVKKANGVICISENTLRDLERLYGSLDKHKVVIHHGNSLSDLSPEDVGCRAPYLFYVGTRSVDYKNFEIVLDALAEIDDLNLVCFGGGALSSLEIDKINEKGLQGRVEQLSGSDEVLSGYYKAAFALVYPSRYEGFGLPPIEAMGWGCPVISSDAPPMPEIIGSAGLFFDPDDKDGLVSAIELLREQESRRKYVELGEEHAKSFSWQKAADHVYAFYEQVMERA